MAFFRTKQLSAVLSSAVTSQNIPIAPATTVPQALTIKFKSATKRSTCVVKDPAGTPDYIVSTQTAGASRTHSASGLLVQSGASTRTVTVTGITASNLKVVKTGAMSDQTVSIALAVPVA